MAREIRISGSGGQGILLAGLVLAEAAGIYEHRHVIQAEDFGGAMRGGAVRSDILIDEKGEEIDYPVVIAPDILIAMNQAAADQWTPTVKDNGIILYDSTNATNVPPSTVRRVYSIAITAIAKANLGTDLGANMVALGILQRVSHIVSEDALRWALARMVPKGTEEFNNKALELGFDIARRYNQADRGSRS
jgi:2-oxoglutarate ferredoxin oxidoreductase subunit gamma